MPIIGPYCWPYDEVKRMSFVCIGYSVVETAEHSKENQENLLKPTPVAVNTWTGKQRENIVHSANQAGNSSVGWSNGWCRKIILNNNAEVGYVLQPVCVKLPVICT